MKKTVNAGMLYNNIFFAVFFLLGVGGMVCLCVLFPSDNSGGKWTLFGFSCLCAAIGLTGFLLFLQTATLSEQGISFRRAFIKVGEVAWRDVVKIETVSLPTLESRGANFHFDWIVLYTDSRQQPPANGGGNFGKKPPWQIRAGKKNIRFMQRFVKQYAPRIEMRSGREGKR